MHGAYWPHFTEQRLYNAAIKGKSIHNPPQTAIFPAPAKVGRHGAAAFLPAGLPAVGCGAARRHRAAPAKRSASRELFACREAPSS